MEVKIVVQLCEFKHDLDSLRLISTRKTSMLFSFENAIAALEDKMWADGVLLSIKRLVKCFLLRQQDYSAVVF